MTAALYAAFGNLIGDFFGTLTLGCLFGFIGNFLYAYVPYRAWGVHRMAPRDSDASPLSGRGTLSLRHPPGNGDDLRGDEGGGCWSSQTKSSPRSWRVGVRSMMRPIQSSGPGVWALR